MHYVISEGGIHLFVNTDSSKPIYVRIAEWLENEILSDNITIDEKMYSQYQLAEMSNINPATAAKGLNLLADESILYKKRGLGMFVSGEAKVIILTKRRDQMLKKLVLELVIEAERLSVTKSELIKMIKDANNSEEEANK